MRLHLLNGNAAVIRLSAVLVPCLAAFSTSASEAGHKSPVSSPNLCRDVRPVGPGHGVVYRGTVTNSDYGISVRLPEGLAGWGAGPDAPFHGFAVYLNDIREPYLSCIIFEVHRVADGADNFQRASEGKSAVVGSLHGTEILRTGIRDGTKVDNIVVNFRLGKNAYDKEVSIMLITPRYRRAKDEKVFRSFLSSFRAAE
jgi:hypothetical protein